MHPLQRVLVDRLRGYIESQWMQHSIFWCGVTTTKILGKTTSAVIDPYADSREAAVNDKIQVVIAVNVNRCDVDA